MTSVLAAFLIALGLRYGPLRCWSGVLGAVGTTVPWFGLVLANLMRST